MPLVLFNPLIGSYQVATTPGQSGPGSDGNKDVFCIPQSSSIAGTSPSDCWVSYLGHSLVGVLPLYRETVGVFYSPSRLGKGCHAEWEYFSPFVIHSNNLLLQGIHSVAETNFRGCFSWSNVLNISFMSLLPNLVLTGRTVSTLFDKFTNVLIPGISSCVWRKRFGTQPVQAHSLALCVRQWPGSPGFNPRSRHTKNSTWYLLA